MSKQDFSSSRFLPLLLLLGTALPAAAQKASPNPPEAAKEPQKLSDAEIAVLHEKRANVVWLQKFIAAHETQIDIGSSLALTPDPCDIFEKDNPALPDAKTFCKGSRALYTIIQKDIKIGTDNLPVGWQEEVEAVEKPITDYKPQHKVFVHNDVDKPDPEFNQPIASNIGRMIDLSKGIVSQEDTVVLSDLNLIDAAQEPMQATLRARLLNYMVDESHPSAEKTEAIRVAIKPSVDKAATSLVLSWLAETLAMQNGMKDGIQDDARGVFLFTAAEWEGLLNKNLREARASAAGVIRAENRRVILQTHSPNADGATASP